MKIPLLLVLPALLAAVRILCALPLGNAAEDAEDPLGFEGFAIAELRERAERTKGPYLRFLDEKTMSAGLYRLKAGTEDKQSPHGEDELYYVVAGEAQFRAGEETRPVRPGDVLFVAAHVEHRFLEITKDLEILVFFSKAESAAKK